MGRKIIFIIMLFSVYGCTDFELHVRKEARGHKPGKILICPFDIRNTNYDPYISGEFADSLRYELFTRGYTGIVVTNKNNRPEDESAWVIKTCAGFSGDILVRGVISQRETGFFSDRKVSSLISFIVYDKNGAVIGEGFYYDDVPAAEQSVRKGAAGKFVSSLLDYLEKAD